MYSNLYKVLPGDQLVTSLFKTGLAKHFAIYLGKNKNGVEWIAENKKFNNVQIIPASEYFARVESIDRIEKFTGNNIERNEAVKRAYKLAGKSYDLINYNCEHYANEVVTGRSFSNQVTLAIMGVVTMISVALLVRQK